MQARIAVLGGDGIGPEVVAEALRCLDAIARQFRHEFSLTSLPFGGAAIDVSGEPLPASAEGATRAVMGAAICAAVTCGWGGAT